MLEYNGKYGYAKVFIDEIDSETVKQIYSFLNHEAFYSRDIRIMPDTHAGAGAVIGFTMPVYDKIIPNIVGVDIGCGITAMNIGKDLFDQGLTRKDFDKIIRKKIPFGFNVRKKEYIELKKNDHFFQEVNKNLSSFVTKYNKKFEKDYKIDEFDWLTFSNLCDKIGISYERAVLSIGTLGGGNHFIEIGKSIENNNIWTTIHSGSRQFGLKVALYHQKKAGEGALAYLEEKDVFDYLVDMVIAQTYAMENREQMERVIKEEFVSNDVYYKIISVHNYIDFDDFIIRKGAISSYKNQYMIIPFNMEDGILICVGKSNPDWNFSAPHGAGRIGSRKWAKKNLNNIEAAKRMREKGIYTSVLPKDELKGAYKDPKIIEKAIEPTAKIIDRIKPILNMKADEKRKRK